MPVLLSAGLLSGCGSGHGGPDSGPAKGSAHAEGVAGQVTVIRDWANALRRGDVRRAAGYFALPSVFANGIGANGQLAAVVIRSAHQARVVNESLSCGAQLISTRRRGKYIVAAFRLTNRSGPGAGCGSGIGEDASTDFLIRHGRIVEWIRAPATGPPPKLAAPSANPQTPAVQI